MFRKVSTLLVLASSSELPVAKDEIVDASAIPASDAAPASGDASDLVDEAFSKEGGDMTSADAATEGATGEGGATTGDGSTTAVFGARRRGFEGR